MLFSRAFALNLSIHFSHFNSIIVTYFLILIVFLAGCAYYNSKIGCQKCYIVGVYSQSKRRVYFADFNAPKRTDEDFRSRKMPDYHKEKSALEDLTRIDGKPLLDMIQDFPTSDPLHLLEEGAMKRLLSIWRKGSVLCKKKITTIQLNALNIHIMCCNKELPTDIKRRLRTLEYVSYWKATEFRTLLLYVGIIIFKDILDEEAYTHFLYLSLATRFYSCEKYVRQTKYKEIARKLLSMFCNSFVNMYGKEEVVSNIHNISHIADDVDRFGSLNSISTYPFENHLHDIKMRIQPSKNAIEQITRRLAEMSYAMENDEINFDLRKFEQAAWTPILKYQINRSNLNEPAKFKVINITPNISFSTKKVGDRWFITKSGDIVEMEFATINDSCIYGTPIKTKTNFFTQPFLSCHADIYLSNGEKDNSKSRLYRIAEIKAKIISFSYGSEYVFIPLLHSLDEISNFYDDCS